MEPNEFTVSAEQHGQLAQLSGDLSNALGALEMALSQLFHILGDAAAAGMDPADLAALMAEVPEQLSFDLDDEPAEL